MAMVVHAFEDGSRTFTLHHPALGNIAAPVAPDSFFARAWDVRLLSPAAMEMVSVTSGAASAQRTGTPEVIDVHTGLALTDDALAALLRRLAALDLDPGCNYVDAEAGGFVRFHGAFVQESAVFNVRTSDPAALILLLASVDAARGRPRYLDDCAYRERAARDYQAGLQASGNDDAFREERREWAATRPRRAGEVARSAEAAPSMAGAAPKRARARL